MYILNREVGYNCEDKQICINWQHIVHYYFFWCHDVKLLQNKRQYSGVITAVKDGFVSTLGVVQVSEDFSKIFIQLDEMNEKYDLKQGYTAGPAKSRDEANRIAADILQEE